MAVTRYVDPAATGTGDGTSWANAYTTLSACMSEVVGIDLAVSGICTIYCRGNVGVTGANRILTNSSITNYVHIRPDPDYVHPNPGKWEAGAPSIIDPGNNDASYYFGLIDIDGSFVVTDMQLRSTANSSSTGRRGGVFWRAGAYLKVERCFIHATDFYNTSHHAGVVANHTTGTHCYVVNNVIVGGWHTGIEDLTGTTVAVAYNNTLVGDGVNSQVGLDVRGAVDTYENTYLYNNIAVDFVLECFDGTAQTSVSAANFNLSEDATAVGANSRTGVYPAFADPAVLDYRLANTDTQAKDFGTDLSADVQYAFSDDIAGTIRSGSWDIGAHEVAAAAITLTVQEATHTHTVDNAGLGMKLAPAEATHSHLADAVVLGVGLVPAETSHNHLADAVVLRVGLNVADGSHIHTADNLGLGMRLTSHEATHAHSVDHLGLGMKLAPADATHGHRVDPVTLKFGLAIHDATHTHNVDTPAVSGHNTLTVADSAHAHTADSPNVSIQLAPASATHAHSVDALAITPKLVVAETSHALTSDHVKINALSVQDAEHGHSVDGGLALVSNHILLIERAVSEHSVDDVPIKPLYLLVLESASHAHSVDTLTLASTYTLAAQDAEHGHSVDGGLILEDKYTLVVPVSRHSHRADSLIVFINDVQIPLERLLIVQKERRLMLIQAEERLMHVQAEERHMRIVNTNRSMT
jgi:hypothetical protein